MRTIRLFTALLTVAVFSFGNLYANGSSQDSKSRNAVAVYDVSLSCHGCKAKLEKNIPWEKGVKDMAVDLENKKVTVTYDPRKTDAEVLKKAIEKLDFTCDISQGS